MGPNKNSSSSTSGLHGVVNSIVVNPKNYKTHVFISDVSVEMVGNVEKILAVGAVAVHEDEGALR